MAKHHLLIGNYNMLKTKIWWQEEFQSQHMAGGQGSQNNYCMPSHSLEILDTNDLNGTISQ